MPSKTRTAVQIDKSEEDGGRTALITLLQSLEAAQTAQRHPRAQTLNAACPRCKADVLKALEEAAYNWGGFGPPVTALLECPECGAELEFRLEWDTSLWKAECFSSKSQEEMAANG